MQFDTISFSGKKSYSTSITNPTNHCGYCGCRIYSDKQIESIAKEILDSKAKRLQKIINSILEKLKKAKHSEEISIVKQIENNEEICFFNNLLAISTETPALSGSEIFQDMYKKTKEEAIEILKRNMRPILKTIDHISPQRLKEKNNNADINLVEACYCCNHDLKKGVSFDEFYAMFPSIKYNMPKDKFRYAVSHILSEGQSQVTRHLSLNKILKSLRQLVLKRKDAVSALNVLDSKIQELQKQIDEIIAAIKEDIEVKKAEISQLAAKYELLSQDDTFKLLEKQELLKNEISNIKKSLESLYRIRDKLVFTINSAKEQSDFDPKICQTEDLNTSLNTVEEQVKALEKKRQETETELAVLESGIPNIQVLQKEKEKLESILCVFSALTKENESIERNIKAKEELENQIETIQLKLEESKSKPYKIKDILEHCRGVIRKIIFFNSSSDTETKQSAKKQPVVIVYENNKIHKKLEKLKSRLEDVILEIDSSTQKKQELENQTKGFSESEVRARIKELKSQIKSLTEQYEEIEISGKMEKLSSEIEFLNQTISDLLRQKDIEM